MKLQCSHCQSENVQISDCSMSIGGLTVELNNDDTTTYKDDREESGLSLSLWCDDCRKTSTIFISNKEGSVVSNI